MKKFLKFFLISLGILILTPFLIIGFYELFPAKIHNQTVSGFSAGFLSNLLKVNVTGILFRDQVWSGEIYVSGPLVIVPWVTLKIEPGTVVKFKHSRDYKNPLRGGLIIKGTLQAIGTPEQPI
ncbi:MAG: hypothetical protein ABII95_02855, partial [Patescibacteria group bacterium]